MQALTFSDNTLKLENRKIPEPGKLEALIRIKYAGICSTDLEIIDGYMQFEGILGHEFIGVVEICDSNPDLIGRRVVGEINFGCGDCEFCKSDLQRHCLNRDVLGIVKRNGVFSEYAVIPIQNLHELPENVSDKAGVLVEPLAAAFEILEQIQIQPSSEILLIGDGRLAQLIARVIFRVTGYVDILGKNQSKINRMTDFIRNSFIGELPKGKSYSTVIEASGSPEGWAAAVNSVKPRGKIVLKSTYADSFDFNPAPIVINEITVVGSRCGLFAPAIKALESGLCVEDLIDATYSLENWKQALAESKKPDVIKVIFQMEKD